MSAVASRFFRRVERQGLGGVFRNALLPETLLPAVSRDPFVGRQRQNHQKGRGRRAREGYHLKVRSQSSFRAFDLHHK